MASAPTGTSGAGTAARVAATHRQGMPPHPRRRSGSSVGIINSSSRSIRTRTPSCGSSGTARTKPVPAASSERTTPSGSGPLTLISGTASRRPARPCRAAANNNRIVEVNAADAPVGISHQHRIRQQLRSAADARGPPGQRQHLLNTPGNGFNRLNGPYDAKVVGDFTGLTPPLGE